MLYEKYISEPQNKDIGYSEYLNKERYKGKSSQTYIRTFPQLNGYNSLIIDRKKDILSLSAYGVGPSCIYKILSVLDERYKEISKELFRSTVRKLCIYFANHFNELDKLIGHYAPKAELLINLYEKNVNKKGKNAFISNICTAEEDIRNLLQKLITICDTEVPEYESLNSYKNQEREIKQQILKCEDKELLNELYAKLISILAKKEEVRKDKPNASNIKAIRTLKSSGFLEAAYRWMALFPYK